MAFSKQVLVYCWISIFLMPLTTCKDESEESGHEKDDYGRRILEIHEGIAYEFVQESMPWAEAHESCEKQGGHLLRDLNVEIKELVQTQYTETGPWWVSRELMYKNSISRFEPVSNVSKDHLACTYMVKDPFQLVTTPDCSMSFSSLCTRVLNTHLTSSEANKRSRRSLTDTLTSLENNIGNTVVLLENAKTMLKDLETATEVLSKENKIKYLQNIYGHLQTNAIMNQVQTDEIMNSTTAMLLYSQECEPDNMDDLEELITLAGYIYGKALTDNGNIVKELPTGTIYVTRQDSSTLGGKIIGPIDGGFCQLPSLTAMTGQLPTGNVNVQLFQFKENPLETKSNESITGTTCSFTLQNGSSTLKLANLPQNIEIYLPRPEAPEPEVVDITWKPGFTITSTFNISDVNMTLVVTALPNRNVTLRVTLYPPEEANATYLNQSTIITYKDNYRWLITPEMTKGIEGAWKVAVLPTDYSPSELLTFKVSVFVTKCLFWDTNLGAWSREGCMVGPNTMPNLTHCLCNHTTFFGSSFFVMPNQVDLSQTAALFATVNENYIVVVLLSCFFALFLVVVMWAWYADRKALRTVQYLDRIMVQDLQTQEVTYFLCSTWLRGEICKRTFNSANMNEVASFGNIFQTRTSSGFRDEHIWVSIVDPPRRSPFTRVQRVSCCMSLLLCTMAINIMFWNLPVDEESPVLLKIGSFELTWQEFMVAIESGLFMFPINILIITIFRHIKPRILLNKGKAGTSKKTTPAAAVSMNAIIKETVGLLNNLSKSPKNMLAAKEIRPETSGDLFWALSKVNDVLQIMQVENVGDPHWSYCSRFVFYSLSHISNLLEHVGEKGFFLNEELRQARGTVSVLLKKAEMATLQHASQSQPSVQVQKKKQGWWLPWWFLFIGWFLLFAMSGISTFFTLLYGFQYGRESSIQWVITLTLSLVQSIFILQPLKATFVSSHMQTLSHYAWPLKSPLGLCVYTSQRTGELELSKLLII
ncbi:polycystic kidney disease protein 1-like 2 [Sinocyclocheilus grahami]|uniref:polycystic kidney disease protein 1-like 2 n=1 Tax=Sinocyclocheilus grahami TaxID=75366 RepID=UPI0007AD289F|nr:PREDICTED: polycystic kidney disease protein 1-like 2 [Sinocyclocheilus grahami]